MWNGAYFRRSTYEPMESIGKRRKNRKNAVLIFGSPNIAPWQPIIKPRRKNSIKHIRFCGFANCLSAYSPCATGGCSGASGWGFFYKNKNHQKVVLIFGSPNIAPRYAINKIKKISLGRFFKIFLIVYSRIRHACLWALPTKTAFSVGTLAHPVGAF